VIGAITAVFAASIAVGLAWLSFFQVPRADSQVQSLRRSAIKEAQFGQLDAGRFRSFSGGAAVFYAERVDADGVLHNVFVRHESGVRIELALAETATYSKGGPNGMHFVTLFNGRRYEGTPGMSEFRVIEFREHGIPISTPADVIGPQDPDTKPTRELWGTGDASDIAQLQSRASSPLIGRRLRDGRQMQTVQTNPGVKLLHPGQTGVFAVTLRARILEGGFRVMEIMPDMTIRRPDGSIRWIFDRGFVVRDPSGRATRFLGLASDTTELVIDEANVGMAPGTAFGAGGERFLRLCFARNPEQLESAVRRVADVLLQRN
jgi:hypothetical protein